jgi:predicted signal transduction protein with EAL and GGDEF domain
MEATDTIAGLRMESEFRSAMNNGQLSLNYQPIVCLKTGGILGFEALMRWISPGKRVYLPCRFHSDGGKIRPYHRGQQVGAARSLLGP